MYVHRGTVSRRAAHASARTPQNPSTIFCTFFVLLFFPLCISVFVSFSSPQEAIITLVVQDFLHPFPAERHWTIEGRAKKRSGSEVHFAALSSGDCSINRVTGANSASLAPLICSGCSPPRSCSGSRDGVCCAVRDRAFLRFSFFLSISLWLFPRFFAFPAFFCSRPSPESRRGCSPARVPSTRALQ